MFKESGESVLTSFLVFFTCLVWITIWHLEQLIDKEYTERGNNLF